MNLVNVSTALVLAVVIACVCLSIRSFRKKGMCGCKEHCGSCGSGSCSACSSASHSASSSESCPAHSMVEAMKRDVESGSKISS
ncbi:hypothetical protein [Slackia sp.]|uniref:hypothetical protein n=1 Tax=Slackia sp. TaxID=2049041 RepID=UPI002606B360|nr:hypothetical protein [Slackia sp.]MEE0518841.1 hypothetical protein [Slackia sp.]